MVSNKLNVVPNECKDLAVLPNVRYENWLVYIVMNINENIGLGENHKVIKEAVRTKLFIQSNLHKRDTFWKGPDYL